jgi:hypothetical protein
MKGLSIAGRKRNDMFDFYETPAWATEELLKREKFNGIILEPCSGAGAISKVLERQYQVQSQDIQTAEYIYGDRGVNFLTWDGEVDNIVTNPPYNLSEKIIWKALEVSRKKVAVIMKLAFLESEKRYRLFTTTPFKKVYVFCKRVQMYPHGQSGPKSGTIAYAWYVWDKDYIGKPTLDWISIKQDESLL